MNKSGWICLAVLISLFIYTVEKVTATTVVSTVVDNGNPQPSKLDPILDKIIRR